MSDRSIVTAGVCGLGLVLGATVLLGAPPALFVAGIGMAGIVGAVTLHRMVRVANRQRGRARYER